MSDGSLLLTRHADLDRVYKDTTTFSSDKKIEFKPKYGDSLLFEHHTTSLVFNDAPLHTRVRKAIVGALSKRALEPLAPRIEVLVDDLLSRLHSAQTFDAVADFASLIPIQVVGDLLCIPQDERGELRDWSLAILGALEPKITVEQLNEGNEAVKAFLNFLDELVAKRKQNMQPEDDDILSRLIRTVDKDDGLLHHELLQNCIFILNAGHETTTNLIASGMLLLSTLPEVVKQLAEQPSMWPTAVEEILRLESPNQLGNRRAIKDFQIDGSTYPAGTQITLCIGAANRDPAVFKSPDTFKLGREKNPHLAFAGGPHLCAGLTVARLEGRIALAKMFQKFPVLKVAGEIVRSQRARFRGFSELPMTG